VDQRDAGLLRWPPHCNLLYPFAPPDKFPALAEALHASLSAEPAFEVELKSFGCFLRETSSVLYLAPSDPTPLLRLHAALLEEFPDRRAFYEKRPFTPHFTVTHFAGAGHRERCEAAARALGEGWEPLAFGVGELQMMERRGKGGAFEPGAVVGLGGEGWEVSGGGGFEGMLGGEDLDWVAGVRKELQQRQRRKARKKGDKGGGVQS
jgi:2'-5' RNA ligase